jgi:uncharacterized membrane protein
MKISRILVIALALTISSVAFAQIGLKGIGGGAGLMGASMTTAKKTGTTKQTIKAFPVVFAQKNATWLDNVLLILKIGN